MSRRLGRPWEGRQQRSLAALFSFRRSQSRRSLLNLCLHGTLMFGLPGHSSLMVSSASASVSSNGEVSSFRPASCTVFIRAKPQAYPFSHSIPQLKPRIWQSVLSSTPSSWSESTGFIHGLLCHRARDRFLDSVIDANLALHQLSHPSRGWLP